MTGWSKAKQQVFSLERPENYRAGIDLCLADLLQVRHQPVLDWLAPQSKVKSNWVGGFRSRFKGRGMDFDESRLYQIGDDIRNIDWRVTARTGEAHTKIFQEERERPVFVVLDQSASMFFGSQESFKSVLAAKLAAQLMWTSLDNGDRFGALYFDELSHAEMKPSNSRKNCMRLLARIVENHQICLARLFPAQTSSEITDQAETTNDLAETLSRLRHLAKPGSLLHIISDFQQFDDTIERRLTRLGQHTDLHLIRIEDPLEKEMPPPGIYGISNGRQTSLLDTHDLNLRNLYHQQYQQRCERIKHFVLARQAILSEMSTSLDQRVFARDRFSKNQSQKTDSHGLRRQKS